MAVRLSPLVRRQCKRLVSLAQSFIELRSLASTQQLLADDASFKRCVLASTACLLFLFSGCQLGNGKPKPISFSATNQVSAPVTRRTGSTKKILGAVQQIASSPADAETGSKSKQKPGSTGIGLVGFVQDKDAGSESPSRPKFELPEESEETTEQTKKSELESNQSDDNEIEIEENSRQAIRFQTVGETVGNGSGLPVEAVLQSTIDFYPEIKLVLEELRIANGKQIQAAGNFDTKLKISSENTPVGFYETYRSKFEVEQPTFNGGSLFAGYRFGRGDIPPWYLERNTNAGGELKLGANWALLRDRQIDARRVALWQSQIQRNAVEPVVHQQLLLVFRDAEIAYWNWVAAGQVYRRSNQLFRVAKDRVDGIEERIKTGDLAEITRTDNDRSILSREVKLIKAKAKLDQAATKLSLYLRNLDGTPRIVSESELPELTTIAYLVDSNLDQLIAEAISCRPETKLIGFDIEAVDLDLAKARNDLLPQLNAQFAVSQDFGRPTSASVSASSSTQTVFVNFDEKDEFQVDAGLFLGQSLQLRKARGKIQSLSGKRRQLEIKRDFLEQKIVAEVQQNHQLTIAAKEQIRAAQQNFALAQQLSEAARNRIETGDVDLFEIILREQQELDAAIGLATAQFAFFSNRANLNASVGCDRRQSYDQLLQTQ